MLWRYLREKRYDMDLEKVALEAVKIKIQEIFDKINVVTEMEGKDIVIRIKLTDEIMNKQSPIINYPLGANKMGSVDSDLDLKAQAAANELLGIQPHIPEE